VRFLAAAGKTRVVMWGVCLAHSGAPKQAGTPALLVRCAYLKAVLCLMFLLQVGYKFGVETHNLLKEAGGDITFKTYNGMAHSVSNMLRVSTMNTCAPSLTVIDSHQKGNGV
jgi:hypothetical protein